MSDGLHKNINQLISKKFISIVKDKFGMTYSLITSNQRVSAYSLHSQRFVHEIKKLYYAHYNELLSMQDVQYICELIEVLYVDRAETVEVCKRIYNDGQIYAYELNADDGKVVWIEEGVISIESVNGIIFKHSANYDNQCMPDLKVRHTRLFRLMCKHFNLKSDREVKLLTLFLVTSLWGLGINHPLLLLTGEKGSSKSTTLRKLERLIDPKSSDVGGIPKGTDGLELRLANTYFVTLDNLSSLSRRISDVLARSVTGGSVTKRALYKDTDEIVLDIKAVIAINGVSLVAKESDLLDRSLILTLQRLSPKEIKTEEELWNEFEKDRPAILGCCFQVLAIAMSDNEPIKTTDLIRLADFHVACIKIGRALGLSEEDVCDILWENQRNVNRYTLDEDTVSLCVIELMRNKTIYTNSVAGLLCDLQDIAYENGMPSTVLPKTPNHLRIRLDKVQNNLKSECGISYSIKNVGAFKEIRIEKNKKIAKVATKEKTK